MYPIDHSFSGRAAAHKSDTGHPTKVGEEARSIAKAMCMSDHYPRNNLLISSLNTAHWGRRRALP